MVQYYKEVIKMLLEFKVGGYYSFKDIQELYLTPYPMKITFLHLKKIEL